MFSITNNKMFRIRNLLLCNPRRIEDYAEDEDGTVSVIFTNNTSITVKPMDDENFYIIITTKKPFGQIHELFKSETNLTTALFTIHKHMNYTTEDQMFNMFRSVAHG